MYESLEELHNFGVELKIRTEEMKSESNFPVHSKAGAAVEPQVASGKTVPELMTPYSQPQRPVKPSQLFPD